MNWIGFVNGWKISDCIINYISHTIICSFHSNILYYIFVLNQIPNVSAKVRQ